MDNNFHDSSDDESSNPLVTLRSGINMGELEEGTEFEVDLNDVEDRGNVTQYDSSNVYKFFKEDMLDNDDQFDDDSDSRSQFERFAAKMENLTPDGGVKKQILQQGVGDIVPQTAFATVHYNAYLEYADEPFDSSRLRQTPLSFDLGSGQVLPGFNIAVASMRKKEQARFLIQASYALGETGCPPRIPGGATCLYVIEMISFIDAGGVGEYFSLPMSERNDAPLELVLKAVKRTKQEAKSHFESRHYGPASIAYRKALNILEQYHLKDENEEIQQKQILLQLYQNLALCSLKLGHFGRVIHNANEALRIEPNSYKARYFKGKALRQQGEFDRAKQELLRAQELSPRSKEINEELQKLAKTSELFHLDEKKMYQRMFPQSDNPDKKEVPSAENVKNAVNSVDNEMSEMFSEKLKIFVDDPELMEVPYSTASHTPDELDALESVAKNMGLLVLRKQQGNNVHIRICKHKSE